MAEHVGMEVDDVTASWQGLTAAGTAVVMVDAPGRPHSCEVDEALRVHELQHPRE